MLNSVFRPKSASFDESMQKAMAIAMAVDVKKQLESIAEKMDAVIADNSVPRNIRSAVQEAKVKAMEKGKDKDNAVSVGTAIYILEDISNDINMPQYARTEIWQIISELESVKEKLK